MDLLQVKQRPFAMVLLPYLLSEPILQFLLFYLEMYEKHIHPSFYTILTMNFLSFFRKVVKWNIAIQNAATIILYPMFQESAFPKEYRLNHPLVCIWQAKNALNGNQK